MIPDFPHNIRIRLARLFFLLHPDIALSLPCWLFQFKKYTLRQPTGLRLCNIRTSQKNSIGPILFLYYEEILVLSNLNSKLFRFYCVRPNVHMCSIHFWKSAYCSAISTTFFQAIEFYFSSGKGSKISEGVLFVPSSKKKIYKWFEVLANYIHTFQGKLFQIQVKTKFLSKSIFVSYENTLWDFVAFKIGHCPQNGADFMPTCSWKE